MTDETLVEESAPQNAGDENVAPTAAVEETPVAEAPAAEVVPVAEAEPVADAPAAEVDPTADPAPADAVVSDAPNDEGSHVVSDALPEVHTPTADAVAIDAADHAKAKDVFASLLGALEEEHKAIARELGVLLSLHTVASGQADTTGDYTAGDLTK